ncbi:MAG: SRPBCC family protein [Patescibacteria group bacterium]|nr:SRPBCC family protein [Patescibacteria group bacterium]
MITLKDSIEIKTTPEKIEEWLRNLGEYYKEWHPDHVKWVNVTGGLDEGDIIYFEEYLHGKLHKFKCKITKIERNKKGVIEFKGLSFLERIFAEKGSFIIEPKEDSCIFTATLSSRFSWLISIFFKEMIEVVKKHMKEEGENLKRLLEKGVKI